MLKLQFPSSILSSILDRVAKLLHLPLGLETDRHYLDKHLQRKIDRDEFSEIYPIPPYDDPLY
jgi:hypothetical protein